MGLEPKPIDAAEHCQIANHPPPLSYRDYTVGWICALPIEMAAAKSMLDEHYPPLPTLHDGGDGQTPYTLGRIGPHYVVLACLPAGVLGRVAASKVADQMQSSFKGIRFGVLVGIGGGVPSKDNGVRLGDVVVSKPTDTFGGVIQYDFGKTIQEGRFKQTGSLNKPPVELLRAISTLQARHMMEDHKLSKYLAEMRSSYPKMAPEFTFPGTQHDSLYEAGYDHTGDATTCSECDAAKLVHRQPRTSDEPVIHYGLIASGDQVMRHGSTRDQLSREHAVLCFEMEAAGLMDTFPCLVIRGICDYADSHKNKLWQGYAAAVAAAYAKELLLLTPGKQVTVTQTSAGVISPSMIAPVPRKKPLNQVPFEREGQFVGRKEILSQIETKLTNRHRLSLHGLGGVGKSQIALEYAYRFLNNNPKAHIFWVYAANAERFDQAYKDVARKMELPRADDPETDVCELVSDWLNGEDSGQWLMILDNADKSDLFLKPLDPKASNRVNVTKKPLIDYLPAKMNSKRSLLITTRDRTLGENLSDGQPSIEVLPFAPEEGILLLRSRTGPVSDGWNDSDAATLVEVLGCIALAITQAAAFMRHNQMPLGRYLKALRGDERNLKDYLNTNLFDHRRERHVPHSIFRTWELSFDQIREQEPRAAEILSLMAMLDRQQIQEKLLRRKGERDAIFVTAMGSLGGLSLITKEVEEDTWTMHRLVQLSIHEWLEQRHQKRKYEEEALALIAGKFPSGEHENREACESLLPHAKSVLKYESDSNTSQIQRADLLYKVSWFHWKQGRYHLAYEKISETNELNKRLFSHLDLRSLNTSSLLASVLRELGKYKESEKLHRQVLKGREKVVGTKHPDTLASINNLAGVLRKQASYKEAEKLYRRALEKRKKLLGLEHPDTLTSFNNLASVLRYQEKFAEAADMHQRAWFGRIKVLGAEHPDTLISLDNLARTLRHQRKFKEAKEMHERVLRSREKELGSEHPTTLSSVHQLAAVFQDEELYEKAEELNRRALEGYEKVLGPDHPDTLHSVSNLAVVLHAKGQYNLASGLYRRTIVGFESCFGPRHATTLIWVGKHDAMLKEVRKIYGPAGINS